MLVVCRWELNSLIGEDLYMYAYIHITSETLKMEGLSSVSWGSIWMLTFGGLLTFNSLCIYFLEINSSFTWDFPVLELRLFGPKGSFKIIY